MNTITINFGNQTNLEKTLEGYQCTIQSKPQGTSTKFLQLPYDINKAIPDGMLFSSQDTIFGIIKKNINNNLTKQAFEAYKTLSNAIGDHHLSRMWNFIPQVLDMSNGVKNYWQFNQGRRMALNEKYGC